MFGFKKDVSSNPQLKLMTYIKNKYNVEDLKKQYDEYVALFILKEKRQLCSHFAQACEMFPPRTEGYKFMKKFGFENKDYIEEYYWVILGNSLFKIFREIGW